MTAIPIEEHPPMEAQAPEARVQSPFPDYAIPRLWVWTAEFKRAVVDDFGPKTIGEFLDDWKRRAPARQTWGVWRGDELGGLVIFEPWSPIAGATHCVFKRSFWGYETTLPALRAVYREIFEGGVEKIVGMVFAHNGTMIALAKKVGFQREGTMRHQTRQDGKPVDMAILGMTKEEFAACRS